MPSYSCGKAFRQQISRVQKQPTGMFCKIGVLKNIAKFTEKHLCQNLITLAQVFSCKFCEIFKNTFFITSEGSECNFPISDIDSNLNSHFRATDSNWVIIMELDRKEEYSWTFTFSASQGIGGIEIRLKLSME